MNFLSRKQSLRFGDFIARAYDIFFRTNREYNGGTEADHISVILGDDFAPDMYVGDESHCNKFSEIQEAMS